MPTPLTKKVSRLLVADIVAASHDLLELARRHELTPEKLAAWANDPANQGVLSGLCVLADLQTQLLLSRYRLLAAGRLIKLATDEDGSADVARRACVDLLKLDLKRAAAPAAAPVESEEGDDGDALRARLYGEEGG